VNLEILYYIWERKARLIDLPICRSANQDKNKSKKQVNNLSIDQTANQDKDKNRIKNNRLVKNN
jgi:hypothetical protein